MKTAAVDFFPGYGDGVDLLAVREGVDAREVLVTARNLADSAAILASDSAISTTRELTAYDIAQQQAAVVLNSLAVALLDSLIRE